MSKSYDISCRILPNHLTQEKEIKMAMVPDSVKRRNPSSMGLSPFNYFLLAPILIFLSVSPSAIIAFEPMQLDVAERPISGTPYFDARIRDVADKIHMRNTGFY